MIFKRTVCILITLLFSVWFCPSYIYASEMSTVIDFETDSVPSVFARRGGKALIAPKKAADGVSNACFIQWGSTYYINDGNSWVNTPIIYFSADVQVEEGAEFICFSTQRYAGNSAFITLSDGDIIVGDKKVGQCEPDKWYNITAVVDRSTDTIDVWVNKSKLADDFSINFIHEDENSYIAFSTQNSSASAYIDDITISSSIPAIYDGANYQISAELNNISDITYSNPMKIALDLRDVSGKIQNAELRLTLSSTELGTDFEIMKNGICVVQRSLNANDRVIYIDITECLTPGQTNEFTLRPCSENVKFSSKNNAYAVISTDPIAGTLVCADFESQSLEEVYTDFERSQEENIVLTDNPDGHGKVMKVTLNTSDALVSGAKRSETVLHSVGGIGMHMWYTFDTYLPEEFVEDGLDIITQWHVYPDDQLGENWRSPVLGLKISGGYFALSSRWDKRPLTDDVFSSDLAGADDFISLGKITKGEWINWTFEINWSTGDDGYIKVWRNGAARLNRTGPNIYNDQGKLNLKQGFYKPSGYDETNLTDKREIYFDNLGIYYDSDILKNVLPKSMHTASDIQMYEKTNDNIAMKLAFKNLMPTGLDANAVYEFADKSDNSVYLRSSEEIVLDDTKQMSLKIEARNIPQESVLNVYLTDRDGNRISNISSTEPIWFFKHYDFEDFVNSDTAMPDCTVKNGYSMSAYDSSLGGIYMSILSVGERNGISVVDAAGADFMDNKVLISAKVRIPEATECSFFNFNEFSTVSTYGLTFVDNKIMYGDLYLGCYENYKWHTAGVLVDTLNQTADVFFDGKLIGEDLNWSWSSHAYIHMYAMSEVPGVRTYTGIDDLIITDNPSYFMENAEASTGIKAEKITVSKSDTDSNKVLVRAEVSNTSSELQSAEFIVAVYENKTLKKSIVTPIDSLPPCTDNVYEVSLTLDNQNQTVKGFVWSSISQMKPLGNS